MEGIGGDEPVFVGAHRVPLSEGDLTVVAATDDADRPALLLAAVNVVGEFVVGADVVELGRGLVVPGTP